MPEVLGVPEIVRELRTTRQKIGLSQEQIANMLDTSQAVVSQWETGVRPMLLAEAVAYAEACGRNMRIGAWLSARWCSVRGCTRKHQAKGLCHPHYLRVWRTGRLRDGIAIGDAKSPGRPRRVVAPQNFDLDDTGEL